MTVLPRASNNLSDRPIRSILLSDFKQNLVYTIIDFLDIYQSSCFYLNHDGDRILSSGKNILLWFLNKKTRTVNSVQKLCNCINIPSSQTFRCWDCNMSTNRWNCVILWKCVELITRFMGTGALWEDKRRYYGLNCSCIPRNQHVLELCLCSPFLGIGRFSDTWSFYTVGRIPWTGDQPVARPLPTQHNKRIQTSVPREGFEPTLPVP
jgi:hypothetical protein